MGELPPGGESDINTYLVMGDPRYHAWAKLVRELAARVSELQAQVAGWNLPVELSAEWQGELFGKLLPQVSAEPFLIVAVCGGTNTGKSVILNHLAAHAVSQSHPLATQTKHPVCCAPQGFSARHDLARVFPDFEIRSWGNAADALAEGADNLLFVREDPTGRQPANLLLLDTPDVDGILSQNHRRAELIRHAADVLVAVLTQQKYNDAAVREFFAAAARADKTLLAVFNMVHWPRQEPLCPGWLEGFAAGTGARIPFAYAAPYDADAAEELRLPFYPLFKGATEPRRDLAELRFDALKLQALAGSLRIVLDQRHGLPNWLRAIATSARQYAHAVDLISHDDLFDKQSIPALPTTLVTNEIWAWLKPRRHPWERVFDTIWRAPWQGIKSAYRVFKGESQEHALSQYREQERASMQLLLERFLDWLAKLRKTDNTFIRAALTRPQLQADVRGLYDELRRRLDLTPLVTQHFRQYIAAQLDAYAAQHPAEMNTIISKLNWFATVRPVVTLTPLLLDFLIVPGSHLLLDGIVGVAFFAADTPLMEAQGFPAIFKKLYTHLIAERETILKDLINELVLGTLMAELTANAKVPQSAAWREVEKALNELGRLEFGDWGLGVGRWEDRGKEAGRLERERG